MTTEQPPPNNSLNDLVLSMIDIEQFLDDLVVLAAATIGGGVSTGLTMSRDGQPATVASSDRAAAGYDEIQYGFDDGPCLRAMRTGQVVLVDDLVDDERFGPYRTRALAAGVRSSLSIPVTGGDRAVGALNVYSGSARHFGRHERDRAQAFADEASRALTLALRLSRHVEVNDQLRAAIASRSVIDHALGIIMGQNRCSADEAFAILRTASQGRNVKLRTIAAEMVAAVSGAEPSSSREFQD